METAELAMETHIRATLGGPGGVIVHDRWVRDTKPRCHTNFFFLSFSVMNAKIWWVPTSLNKKKKTHDSNRSDLTPPTQSPELEKHSREWTTMHKQAADVSVRHFILSPPQEGSGERGAPGKICRLYISLVRSWKSSSPN